MPPADSGLMENRLNMAAARCRCKEEISAHPATQVGLRQETGTTAPGLCCNLHLEGTTGRPKGVLIEHGSWLT